MTRPPRPENGHEPWLDLSAYPDLDPDAVASPWELTELRRMLAGPPGAGPDEGAWQAMLEGAVHPPDLVDVARDAFDDTRPEPADDPGTDDDPFGGPAGREPGEPDQLGAGEPDDETPGLPLDDLLGPDLPPDDDLP